MKYVFKTLVWVFLMAVLVFAHSHPAKSQTPAEHSMMLPFIVKETVPTPNPNPIYEGEATWYYADGTGACSFDASPQDMLVAAMNIDQWDNSAYCGSYVHAVGPLGEVTVRIVDLCPGCSHGDIDLSQEAFSQIANLSSGRVPVSWQVVSPELSGPIAYHFKDGSNQWWTAVQIRNHRNPVANLEFLDDGQWVNVPRTYYNYFVQYQPGMGVGPFTFRVTDVYGNQLVDSDIPHLEDTTIEGAAQFPPGP
jgi:expansin (peptidoglycan-binding protein)